MNGTGYLHALHPHPDPKIIDQVLSEIDSATLSKILNQTALPVEHLISPKSKSRKGNIPRPQNPFVIYRRDFMAKLVAKYGPEIASNLPFVSKKAGNWWKHEDQEIKNIYEVMADLAKKVHERMYPDYIFKPKKKRIALNRDFDHLITNDHYQPPPSPPRSLYHISLTNGSNSSIPQTIETNNNFSQLVLPPIDSLNNYDRRLCRSFHGP